MENNVSSNRPASISSAATDPHATHASNPPGRNVGPHKISITLPSESALIRQTTDFFTSARVPHADELERLASLDTQGNNDLQPESLESVPNEIVAIDEQLSMLPSEPLARQQRLNDICNELVRLHHGAWDASSEFMVNCVKDKLLEIRGKHAGAGAESALQDCAKYCDESKARNELEAARLDLDLPRLAFGIDGHVAVAEDDTKKKVDFTRMRTFIDASTCCRGSLSAKAMAAYIRHAKQWPDGNPFTPAIERALWLQHARTNPEDAHQAIEAWKATLVIAHDGKWEGLFSDEVAALVSSCEAWADAGSSRDAEQALQVLNSLPKHIGQEFVQDAVLGASLRICARGKLQKATLEKQVLNIVLHPRLGKLSGAKVPLLESLLQLDADWLSRRIKYMGMLLPDILVEGIVDAKRGVDPHDLLRPYGTQFGQRWGKAPDRYRDDLLSSASLWNVPLDPLRSGLLFLTDEPDFLVPYARGLILQVLRGELTEPQWHSVVTLVSDMVKREKEAYASMMRIFLALVRNSPAVGTMLIEHLLPCLLERSEKDRHMMLAALLAAQSVVIGSESKALHLLGNEGPASVYFHLCLYDHHLRNNNRQSAQVCLLQAIDLYGIHHARNPRSFDVDKDLFNRLKALKDDGSRRAVPAGPPGQTTYTAPNKLV